MPNVSGMNGLIIVGPEVGGGGDGGGGSSGGGGRFGGGRGGGGGGKEVCHDIVGTQLQDSKPERKISHVFQQCTDVGHLVVALP